MAKQRVAPDKNIARVLQQLLDGESGPSTQPDLERKSKVGQSTISRILLGETNPTISTLRKLAAAYNKPVDVFFEEDHTNSQRPLDLGGVYSYSTRGGVSWEAGKKNRAPVIGAAKMYEDGSFELEGIAKGGSVPSYSGQDDCYALQVTSDALHPVIRMGSFLVMSPTATLSAEEEVLVELNDGNRYVFELLATHRDSLSVIGLKDARRRSIPMADIKHIHAVVARVPRSQWRADP